MRILKKFSLLSQLYSEYRRAVDLCLLTDSPYHADVARATAVAFNGQKFFWMPRLREKG